jgi:hypothetical protein
VHAQDALGPAGHDARQLHRQGRRAGAKGVTPLRRDAPSPQGDATRGPAKPVPRLH